MKTMTGKRTVGFVAIGTALMILAVFCLERGFREPSTVSIPYSASTRENLEKIHELSPSGRVPMSPLELGNREAKDPNADALQERTFSGVAAQQKWLETYGEASLEELITSRTKLSKALDTASQPEFRWRLENGFGEYLGNGTTLSVTDPDPLEVSAYIFQPRGEGIYKVVLPPNEFPELYEMRAEIVWLEDVIEERQHLAEVAAN